MHWQFLFFWPSDLNRRRNFPESHEELIAQVLKPIVTKLPGSLPAVVEVDLIFHHRLHCILRLTSDSLVETGVLHTLIRREGEGESSRVHRGKLGHPSPSVGSVGRRLLALCAGQPDAVTRIRPRALLGGPLPVAGTPSVPPPAPAIHKGSRVGILQTPGHYPGPSFGPHLVGPSPGKRGMLGCRPRHAGAHAAASGPGNCCPVRGGAYVRKRPGKVLTGPTDGRTPFPGR